MLSLDCQIQRGWPGFGNPARAKWESYLIHDPKAKLKNLFKSHSYMELAGSIYRLYDQQVADHKNDRKPPEFLVFRQKEHGLAGLTDQGIIANNPSILLIVF